MEKIVKAMEKRGFAVSRFASAAEAREYDMIQAEATAPLWDPCSLLEMWKSDSPDNLTGFGAAG